jgi:SNF2 family DNA or RNA helicase
LVAVPKSVLPQGIKSGVEKGELRYFKWDSSQMATLYYLGMDVTGLEPLHFKYDFPRIEGKFPPMPHKIETAAFLNLFHRAYCTSTMRTGKTGAVAMALDYTRRHDLEGKKGAALIVAPLSTLQGVWHYTLSTTLPWSSSVVVHHSKPTQRRALLKAKHDYYIINYEGLVLLRKELEQKILDEEIQYLVLDELTHYGNATSERWRAAKALTKVKPMYIWGLTGTPGGNPLAVYGYSTLINPSVFPWQTLTAWRDQVMERWGMAPWQVRERPMAKHLIHKVLQPCVRFAKEQVIKNLPRVVFQARSCELSRPQSQAIEELRQECRTRLESGEVLTLQQKAQVANKVFQIALGRVLVGADGKSEPVKATARVELLREMVLENERKTVIFCAFRGVLEDRLVQLKDGKPKIKAALIYGATSAREREAVFKRFQQDDDLKVLLAHPQTTAYGVELAEADQMIFDGPPLSGVQNYLQALERCQSARQKSDSVAIVHLSATAEERRFFAALDERKTGAEAVADMFNTFIVGADE